MIKIDHKKLTPQQAAKLIIKDGLDQFIGDSLTHHWDRDTYSGEELARVMNQREWLLVNYEIFKIWGRIDKLLEQGEQA